MKNDRPRAFAVLVAVFLIGIIIGAAGIYQWQKSSAEEPGAINERYPPPPNDNPPKPPEFNLTAEQEDKLGEIWTDTREKLLALGHLQREWMKKGDDKRKEIWEENDRKVREILNDEQRAIFDPWLEKFRTWRERPPRRMGPEMPKENRKQSPRHKGPISPNENQTQPDSM